jgi:two-component system, OmpR family, response regulator
VDPTTSGRPDPAGVPPLRVLCVDDNRDIADSEAVLLQIVGFETRACYDGPSALAEAARFLPGVCLLDLNMPGMDGDELAVRLRAQAAGTPLVLVALTAMSNEECGGRIRNAGFDLHLIKPVDPFNLVAVVDSLWRAWETDEAHRRQGS